MNAILGAERLRARLWSLILWPGLKLGELLLARELRKHPIRIR